MEAFLHPRVDSSDEPFEWGAPDLPQLQDFCFQKFGWRHEYTDSVVNPVLARLEQRLVQTRIDQNAAFFHRAARIRSTRIAKVVMEMTKGTAAADDLLAPSAARSVGGAGVVGEGAGDDGNGPQSVPTESAGTQGASGGADSARGKRVRSGAARQSGKRKREVGTAKKADHTRGRGGRRGKGARGRGRGREVRTDTTGSDSGGEDWQGTGGNDAGQGAGGDEGSVQGMGEGLPPSNSELDGDDQDFQLALALSRSAASACGEGGASAMAGAAVGVGEEVGTGAKELDEDEEFQMALALSLAPPPAARTLPSEGAGGMEGLGKGGGMRSTALPASKLAQRFQAAASAQERQTGSPGEGGGGSKIGKGSGGDELSEYEKQRLARINSNQKVLRDLGLDALKPQAVPGCAGNGGNGSVSGRDGGSGGKGGKRMRSKDAEYQGSGAREQAQAEGRTKERVQPQRKAAALPPKIYAAQSSDVDEDERADEPMSSDSGS